MKSWHDPLTDRSHGGEVLDSKDGFDVIACRDCGFKHVVPLPSDRELHEFYAKEFYSHEKPEYFRHFEEDLEWWLRTYQSYYFLLERHAPGRRLLEIGSGPGYFLKCGQDRGWEALGFEPSLQAYRYSSELGVRVVNDFFTAAKAAPYGKFDAIVLKTVMEHLADPIPLLTAVKTALNPRGAILVVSPNDYNLLQTYLREHLGFAPWWVVPPQHINYFNFDSIRSLLERIGFEVIESLATFPMEFFLLCGENYVGNDTLGRQCHMRRKTFEMHLYETDPQKLEFLYRSLAEHGIGREFVILGCKQR